MNNHNLICIGGVLRFSEPSGILTFGDNSVQSINLSVIYDDRPKVCVCILMLYIIICTYE